MKIIFKSIFIIFISFSLQSCFVAKDYERPEEITDELKFRTENIETDTNNIAKLSWKNIFEDEVLQQHIDEALENNQDIRIALQQIQIANSYFKQGKAGYYPSLNVNGEYTHQELAPNSQFGSFFSSLDQYELSASLSWEADIWGKIRSNKRAFQAQYLQTQAAHKAVKTELIANVASAYFQLMALDEQIKTTEITIENRKNSLEVTKALKDAGNVNSVAVNQTKAQLHTAEAILLDLENDTKLLENTLSILLGKTPEKIVRNSFENQNVNDSLMTGVPSDLLENRPDVIQAEYQFINAFEMTNVAKSNFYPSITISATSGLQSLSLSDFISGNSIFATFIGGLTQPIFNRRQIKTEYEVAQSEQKQAFLNFEKTLITASKEVSDAILNYEYAKKKIKIKTSEYEAYQSAVEDSQELLKNGLANYLEVLNARENSLNTKLDLINAELTKYNAMIDLYRSLGGGWQ
ncbi:TolC family protein [Psychroflexus aestuariivivens]|uniref:TolC family protein n=1 Tax=Psychroflexus aestuariivivens TaxID=1795040 RepID=UPI000FDA085B|nr:TolC family protein [Psychroflexus aestuariivivens]